MFAVPLPVISRSLSLTWQRPSTWPTSWPSVHWVAPWATTAPGCPAGWAAQPLNGGTVDRTKYATTSLRRRCCGWRRAGSARLSCCRGCTCRRRQSLRAGRFRFSVDACSTAIPAVAYTSRIRCDRRVDRHVRRGQNLRVQADGRNQRPPLVPQRAVGARDERVDAVGAPGDGRGRARQDAARGSPSRSSRCGTTCATWRCRFRRRTRRAGPAPTMTRRAPTSGRRPRLSQPLQPFWYHLCHSALSVPDDEDVDAARCSTRPRRGRMSARRRGSPSRSSRSGTTCARARCRCPRTNTSSRPAAQRADRGLRGEHAAEALPAAPAVLVPLVPQRAVRAAHERRRCGRCPRRRQRATRSARRRGSPSRSSRSGTTCATGRCQCPARRRRAAGRSTSSRRARTSSAAEAFPTEPSHVAFLSAAASVWMWTRTKPHLLKRFKRLSTGVWHQVDVLPLELVVRRRTTAR